MQCYLSSVADDILLNESNWGFHNNVGTLPAGKEITLAIDSKTKWII